MNDSSPAVSTIRFDPTTQGDPNRKTTTIDWYSDPTNTFRSGFWSATPAKYDIAYEKDELCVLIEGTVRLTNSTGEVATYTAGDTFLIPCGFRGTWESIGAVRKFSSSSGTP